VAARLPARPVIVLATLVAPVAYVGGAIWLGTHGMATLAEAMAGLLAAGVVAAVLMGLARRSLFPRVAEFDGQVIRQWVVKGDSESPDQYTASRSTTGRATRPGTSRSATSPTGC